MTQTRAPRSRQRALAPLAAYAWLALPAAARAGGGDGGIRGAFDWLGGVLPAPLVEVRVLDVALWQWLALLVLVVLASALGYAITAVALRALGRIVAAARAGEPALQLRVVSGPLRLFVSVAVFYTASLPLGLADSIQLLVSTACKALTVVATSWLVLRVVDVLAEWSEQRLASRDPSAAQTLVPMGRRLTKVFVLAISLVALIDNLGFNVTGLVAGLGVGGLAVALAAQKTVENLFGGFTVIADRPVTVGQFCRVGEHIGTIEDIGLRSTRLRTLDRTVVTIPNAEFSTARIENFALRDRMRLFAMIGVGYDTSPDQLRYLLVEIRKMLYAHAKTLPDPCRVRFVNFGPYSLDLEVFVFVGTRDWNEFLGVREDIFLRIMDIVAESGAYFAYPSQTLYLGKDEGRDGERTREAEEAVRGWREAGAIPLPEFPPEQIREIDDTLEFPPPGSAQRATQRPA